MKLVLAALVLMTSCTSSSTQLIGSWRDGSYPSGSLHKPLVIAVSNRPLVREKIEDALTSALHAARVDAVPSHLLMTDRELDVDSVKAKLASTDCDSVMVTHLVDVKLETVVVTEQRATGAAMPVDHPRYADHWTDYYVHSWAVVSQPAYSFETKKYVLETNLFDAKTQARVWSAVTESEEPSTLDSAVEAFANVIVSDIEKHRLF